MHDNAHAMTAKSARAATSTSLLAPLSSSHSDKSLLEMMDDATARLQRMEVSCRDALRDDAPRCPPRPRGDALEMVPLERPVADHSDTQHHIELLQIQVAQLKRQLIAAVHYREDSDAIFQTAMGYAAAKGTANAVLHALFDQASLAKCQVLEQWMETGVIPTRDGLRHWRLDLRGLRNETGATLLHVAVDTSMARQNLKVKCVELLIDRVGFDVNVRDAFGRTPLHVAAMAGYADVTQALLARGADATLRDRAGLSPLSVVRTLSKPPAEVVQLLAAAEYASVRQSTAASNRIPPHTAIASTMFLRVLGQFVRPPFVAEFAAQTNRLLDLLLAHKHEQAVAFDELLRGHVPLLFDSTRTPSLTNPDSTTADAQTQPALLRLESLFLTSMYWDAHFEDELKVEAAAYGHSLVASTSTTAVVRAGATWEGLILKLIQAFKVEIATPLKDSASGVSTTASETHSTSTSERTDQSPSPSPTARSTIYADRVSAATLRQAWHYAVLFKSSSQPLPGFLNLKKGESTATCSEDIGRFFPLHDRLILGSSEYHCVSYDPANRAIELDREYEGANAPEMKAYLAGSGPAVLPPYVAAKRLWEREPGNMYEEHTSAEQDLFQDYQFLDPDSEYEAAVKLGPVSTAREAKSLVDDWKAQARKLFDEKKCISGLAACEHYCPQRSGHSLCVDTMAAIGREIAKERFGRATFSKQLKPRASLQKYQDRFLGKATWPGSPSTGVSEVSSRVSASLSPDFT